MIGLARCGGEAVIGQVGDGDEADMGVLAVERAAGQRLVDILEPVGADEVGIVGDCVQIAGIGGAAFAFSANPDESLPKETAVGRTEVKFTDQRGLAERMKAPPILVTGDRPSVAVEADDIAPPRAGLDCLPGLPGAPAAPLAGVLSAMGPLMLPPVTFNTVCNPDKKMPPSIVPPVCVIVPPEVPGLPPAAAKTIAPLTPETLP